MSAYHRVKKALNNKINNTMYIHACVCSLKPVSVLFLIHLLLIDLICQCCWSFINCMLEKKLVARQQLDTICYVYLYFHL